MGKENKESENQPMEIVYKKINEIKPYENNPRINDGAVDAVANSIKEFGFKVPIVIDKNNIIINGHTRLKSAKKLGLKEVPCIIADDLSEQQIKAFRLADNKTSELAEWDMDLLAGELGDLITSGWEMEEFGFDKVVDEEEPEVVDDYYNVDEHVPEEPKSKLGDIYQLGKHRLMCGDSTSIEDLEKLMNGETADMLYTDPPYNVNVENSDGLKIENDNMEESAFREFLENVFYVASENMKPGAPFYIWHGDSERVTFQETAQNHGLEVKQCLIWVKNSFNFGRQDYKWMHEPVLYGWKTGAGHYFVEEYNHPTVIEEEQITLDNLDDLKKDELKDIVRKILEDNRPSTIFHENKPVKNDLHPTMKPIKLCADMIKNSSKKDELVLDLFGGSGSTLIACEQLGRKCYINEYDPKYVDVIINRWETFTGEKAVKVNG